MTRPVIIAGNWKMNKTIAQGLEFLDALHIPKRIGKRPEIMIFPAATALYSLSRHRPELTFGAQNIHEEASGAYTGELSAEMVRECASVALIGHSERRHIFLESDARINKKVKAALAAGLRAILCVGETLEQRKQEKTAQVVLLQLDLGLEGLDPHTLGKLIIAYEPVWAIGTGLTATPNQAQTVHLLIRDRLTQLGIANTPILYGGSVKPDNTKELLGQADIDGLLIGGASLQAQNFSDIISLSFELLA